MTIEQLRKYSRAEPFHPFVLHVADGSTVPVRHPEVIAQTPSGRTVWVGLPDESSRIIDILMITQIELLPPVARGTNGRTRKRK